MRDDLLAAPLFDRPTNVDTALASAGLARDMEGERVAGADRERLEQRQGDLIPVRAPLEGARRQHDARNERALPPEREAEDHRVRRERPSRAAGAAAIDLAVELE